MTETKHTPGPFAPIDCGGRRLRGGRGPAYDLVGNCDKNAEHRIVVASKLSQPDAAFFALAANAHDDLLEACKASVAEITGGSLYPECLRPLNETPLDMLKAAIAKACGE